MLSGMAVLRVARGHSTATEFRFEEEISIGRAEECAVRVFDEAASRRHAVVKREEGGYFAVDLGSANGLFVNGRRVARQRLRSGDEVSVRGLVLLFLEEDSAHRPTVIAEEAAAPPEPARAPPATEIVGASAPMAALLAEIDRVARTDATVLVTGETGTGKELVARALHERSARRKRPFVAVNCAAIPEPLLEAELFGHERGAFTGADRARSGRFEQADRGTLFLDEIGELPLPLQAKLLRVLETLEFHRVGAEKPTRVDVRIVAATNRDLRAGGFREDLYHRLSVVTLRCPPLRERRGDIPLLVGAFLPGRHVDPDALAILEAHPWPGNVRELRNFCERCAAFADGPRIDAALVRSRLAPAPAGEVKTLREVELEEVRKAMQKTGGNKTQAARLLGISFPTLLKKLKEL